MDIFSRWFTKISRTRIEKISKRKVFMEWGRLLHGGYIFLDFNFVLKRGIRKKNFTILCNKQYRKLFLIAVKKGKQYKCKVKCTNSA